MNNYSLTELYDEFETYRKSHPLSGHPESLYNAMQYIMELGGKRARPLLVLTSCLSAGGDVKLALPVALAIEQFHNFTLIHDDIMDNADKRRGKSTVHKKWSIPTAILAGDNLLVAAYQVLFNTDYKKKTDILLRFNAAAREVSEGQQMDMDFAEAEQVTEEQYIEMIRLKTAVLLGCSAACGALCANADAEKTEHYYRFAVDLGLSFQLRDDYLDTFGDSNKTGKKLGGDIKEKKKMWLYVASAQLSNEIKHIYDEPNAESRINQSISLFQQQGLDKKLLSLAEQYEENAKHHLTKLSNLGEETALIKKLFKMLADREH